MPHGRWHRSGILGLLDPAVSQVGCPCIERVSRKRSSTQVPGRSVLVDCKPVWRSLVKGGLPRRWNFLIATKQAAQESTLSRSRRFHRGHCGRRFGIQGSKDREVRFYRLGRRWHIEGRGYGQAGLRIIFEGGRSRLNDGFAVAEHGIHGLERIGGHLLGGERGHPVVARLTELDGFRTLIRLPVEWLQEFRRYLARARRGFVALPVERLEEFGANRERRLIPGARVIFIITGEDPTGMFIFIYDRALLEPCPHGSKAFRLDVPGFIGSLIAVPGRTLLASLTRPDIEHRLPAAGRRPGVPMHLLFMLLLAQSADLGPALRANVTVIVVRGEHNGRVLTVGGCLRTVDGAAPCPGRHGREPIVLIALAGVTDDTAPAGSGGLRLVEPRNRTRTDGGIVTQHPGRMLRDLILRREFLHGLGDRRPRGPGMHGREAVFAGTVETLLGVPRQPVTFIRVIGRGETPLIVIDTGGRLDQRRGRDVE